MLTEKYRPKELKDLFGMDKTVGIIKKMLEKPSELPHMVFTGPEGTGKTSLALIVAKKVDADVLELNASNERGIDTVRTKIKDFTRVKSIGNRPRIVFLDEADALTKDAQNALRRIMENSKAIFILTANNKSKIIAPLLSRNTKFDFTYPNDSTLKGFIQTMLIKEDIGISNECVEKIVEESKEFRDALSIIEKVKMMTSVTPEDIKSNCPARKIWKMLQTTSATKIVPFISGKEPVGIITMLSECVIESEYDSTRKGKMIALLSRADARIATGATGKIQVENVLYGLVEIMK